MHACNAQVCNDVTLAELLSVRDGEPVDAGALSHIQRCARCAQELNRLRELKSSLAALPEFKAPAYNLAALKARLHTTRSYRIAGLAAASVSALAVMIGVNVNGVSDYPTNQYPTQEAVLPGVPEAQVEDFEQQPTVGSLVIRSQELEARLQRLPQRPRVERASTSMTIDSLQDRIQWVDYQLSLASDVGMTEKQAAVLWQDRVQLMNSLVMVRYAEMQRTAYYVPTSGSSL